MVSRQTVWTVIRVSRPITSSFCTIINVWHYNRCGPSGNTNQVPAERYETSRVCFKTIMELRNNEDENDQFVRMFWNGISKNL